MLPEAAKNSLQFMQQLVVTVETTSAECQRSGEAKQDKVDRIRKILEQAKNAYEFVKQEIGNSLFSFVSWKWIHNRQ